MGFKAPSSGIGVKRREAVGGSPEDLSFTSELSFR